MNSAKWLDETRLNTFESIFIFTEFGKFERWVLILFEGCTLTIPQLPLGGFKEVRSLPDLERLEKERKAKPLRTSGGGAKEWKILADVQTSGLEAKASRVVCTAIYRPPSGGGKNYFIPLIMQNAAYPRTRSALFWKIKLIVL